jgi:hypothetical protein
MVQSKSSRVLRTSCGDVSGIVSLLFLHDQEKKWIRKRQLRSLQALSWPLDKRLGREAVKTNG